MDLEESDMTRTDDMGRPITIDYFDIDDTLSDWIREGGNALSGQGGALTIRALHIHREKDLRETSLRDMMQASPVARREIERFANENDIILVDCGKPCAPGDDAPCDACVQYWNRMRREGFWDDSLGWTDAGMREMRK